VTFFLGEFRRLARSQAMMGREIACLLEISMTMESGPRNRSNSV